MRQPHILLLLLYMATNLAAKAQRTAVEEIQYTLTVFFEALNNADSAALRRTATTTATLYSIEEDGSVEQMPFYRFVQIAGKSRAERWEERISYLEIRIDGRMATAWAPYRFYVNDQLSHCGVNAITLVQPGHTNQWLIHTVTDTRHLQGCHNHPYTATGAEAEIQQLLDQWHLDAANANADNFFHQIAPDGYYLGTDASETWTKDEFYQFAKPYFDKGKAWNFRPIQRQVFIAPSGSTAWVQEQLDTWMGICRGTAVLVRAPHQPWLIQQYNLSILVPNDLVNDYLKLLQHQQQKAKEPKK